jgi:putative membrane protein
VHLPLGVDWMWMGIPWVLVLVVIVVLAARGRQNPESPEEILKRRYASGQITRDEYERMLQEIRR